MEIKKKALKEIIDSNGSLIGLNDIPQNGSDLESQAHGTTDTNAKIGQQPFRYDMMGRFGFSNLPFMEEGTEDQGELGLISDLSNLMYERYKEILGFYYKNPNKLKSDYRKISNGTADSDKEVNVEYAEKIMRIVKKHFEIAFKEPETIDEGAVVEDKVVDKRGEDEISTKSNDNGVREKRLEKIAGLINKLDKKDVNKLINLLEGK